jgi:hypothetical protein
VLTEWAAVDHHGAKLRRRALLDAQLQPSIVQQQAVAAADGARQVLVRRRHPSFPAFEITHADEQLVAGVKIDGFSSHERPRANLRTAQVLQNRDASLRLACRLPNTLHERAVAVARSVREVQAEDIDAGRDELAKRRVTAARGPERRHDLRMPHVLSLQYELR